MASFGYTGSTHSVRMAFNCEFNAPQYFDFQDMAEGNDGHNEDVEKYFGEHAKPHYRPLNIRIRILFSQKLITRMAVAPWRRIPRWPNSGSSPSA